MKYSCKKPICISQHNLLISGILSILLLFSNIFGDDNCCSKNDCSFQTCVSCDHECDNREIYQCEDNTVGKTFYAFQPQYANTISLSMLLPII
jgi:hypothetical protein